MEGTRRVVREMFLQFGAVCGATVLPEHRLGWALGCGPCRAPSAERRDRWTYSPCIEPGLVLPAYFFVYLYTYGDNTNISYS